MAGKGDLDAAKRAKKDEFYTQWADIEAEMVAYLEHNPDVFRDKTILLPCDPPDGSKFTAYFIVNFTKFGLRKLVSTCKATGVGEPSDPVSHHGQKFTLTRDTTSWEFLEGDGDFRSPEVTALRDEADIVITNPPFSLFREFVNWLMEGANQFAVIGSLNAITYKDVFPLIQDGKLWLGATSPSGEFRVPDSYTLTTTNSRTDEHGKKFIRVGGVCWYTNLDFDRRHTPLQLATLSENVRGSKHAAVRAGYRLIDNFDALDVPFTDAIPSDYTGLMGVPISFLHKHDPTQFVLRGIAKTWDGLPTLRTKTYPPQVQVSRDGRRSKTTVLNAVGAVRVDQPPTEGTYYEVGGGYYVTPYARLLIQRR